ncbi:DUF4440 domain-containing protein [Angustibacter sp. Root456]|uniref:DUF4440 domain-containing protein n=1 Tax=Angustibacter sp. Root456 TaxID=1736539 RepID=UPI000701B465|nr:DUF4440 domain-containing protein [Angustibacter sp. Root456]KQX62166.1 hypothetical protein ASD06_14810 [Angustibacter sp. Root456]
MTDDERAIDDLVRTFFAAFTQGPDLSARLDQLAGLFLPEALIVRTCGAVTTYDVAEFIAPRRELLTSSRIAGFREWEVAGTTQVYGDVAHHWCTYAKAWTEGGVAVTGAGGKTMQFVRIGSGWKISAVAWDDER